MPKFSDLLKMLDWLMFQSLSLPKNLLMKFERCAKNIRFCHATKWLIHAPRNSKLSLHTITRLSTRRRMKLKSLTREKLSSWDLDQFELGRESNSIIVQFIQFGRCDRWESKRLSSITIPRLFRLTSIFQIDCILNLSRRRMFSTLLIKKNLRESSCNSVDRLRLILRRVSKKLESKFLERALTISIEQKIARDSMKF